MKPQFLPLDRSHVGQVWELSGKAYPGSFHLSVEQLLATFDGLTPQENFCLGVFVDDVLIGYLMCWLDTSQVEERGDEPVLLLDDIVVLGASRAHLFGLLRALRRAIQARGQSHLAIEGTHRQQAEALFSGHPQLVELLGYRQAATHHYFGEREQEPLCWARYEPV